MGRRRHRRHLVIGCRGEAGGGVKGDSGPLIEQPGLSDTRGGGTGNRLYPVGIT